MTDKELGFIREIEIINVQSHGYSYFELSPGVNVIKGDSHKGKSAIMRGLEELFFNDAPGLKSHFAKDNEDMEIGVTFTDDSWVTRKEGKKNSYYSNKHPKGLHTIGRGNVPDEIKEITRIDNINFQSQGDKYFLLDESPGYVGRKFNEFIGLEIIDETKTIANKIVNETTLRLKINKEDIETTEEKLQKFDDLDKIESIINRTKTLIEKKKNKEERIQRINSIIEQIKVLEKQTAAYDEWLLVEHDYNIIIELVGEYKESEKRHTTITKLVNSITECDTSEMKEWLNVETEYKILKKQFKEYSQIVFKHDKIKKMYVSIQNAQKRCDLLNATLESKKKRQTELQKVVNYCSKCGANKKYWRKR